MAGKKEHPECYFLASACAATFNYPLWKASAIAQSGFTTLPTSFSERFGRRIEVVDRFVSALSPPYRGAPFVISGMTWARAAIFYGSDIGRKKMNKLDIHPILSTTIPPLVLSSFVQCVNMPLVRASITMQNPKHIDDPNFRTTFRALKFLVREKGFFGLWHGLSAGIAKSVPKYCTSVVVKDVMEDQLPPAESRNQFLLRAMIKAVVAGVAGATLTNPMDVIRNEMFKTDKSLIETIHSLRVAEVEKIVSLRGANEPVSVLSSMSWVSRGLGPNLIAVSIPITITIFLTDVFIGFKQ
mmetsp:Transcript_11215/g.12862  ORF Transcript_11215/g.12862 Transcript_11215/m.12862 type:complete len:298 (+) Transcript_11215:318-1211(+)|eukprot:CAMPEP_0184028212 /NCGR_PEP_ID=MMETSP0954-20121128/14681_1 /TAXON_ID=627963 /ORGANISM="Aplanochytrium sp, Strain PBS07" /LENGTH=297 /DNA_ID=CAMNT_0026312963 /DNA_START=67 /DNA_END=960 /DNA_ORIENTATION=-